MGNYKHWAGLLLTVLVPVSYADQASSPVTSGEDSFAQIEALDQHVEQANKQIDALKVSQQLKDLQDKANRLSMDFVVERIVGVNYQLSAVLMFNNKNEMTVKTGDVIENQFKVTAITATAVYVYDTVNQVARIVPFA